MAVVAFPQSSSAKGYNDKVLNRPYADLRRWHLGFSVGLHTQDLNFAHSGYVTDAGESWFVEQPSFQPGFCVNGLFDVRLNNWFNVRLSPGLYYGSRDLRLRNVNTDEELRQNLKSTYIVLPVDLKYSALRYRNARPYISGGVMPAFNLTRKANDYLRLKPMDLYLTVGLGCDIYFPYFKFIPEIKFCFGIIDVIDHERNDLVDDPMGQRFTKSIKKATSQMVVLTFYFE